MDGGYEYSSYSIFRGADEIVPLYPIQVCNFPKGFLFEIRTKFFLITRVNNIEKKKKLVGSERFAVSFSQQGADSKCLERELNFRLKDDYRMSFHEIQYLAREAFDLATWRRKAKHSKLPVTAVVVELSVCTVQLVGESARAFDSRTIRPERLVPIPVCPLVPKEVEFEDDEG